MQFEENLKALRKQNGLSQEALAERLNVSRQAVSKWENGSAYPELDKLMLLCDLFSCSMDDMLQGDMQSKGDVSKAEYETYHNRTSAITTFGISVILLGVTFYCFLEPSFLNKEVILDSIFMLFILIGAITLIYASRSNTNFNNKHERIPQNIYKEKEIALFKQQQIVFELIAISLCIGAVIMQQIVEYYFVASVANGIFMFMITCAISIFVYRGLQNEKYKKTQVESIHTSSKDQLLEKSVAAIMLVSTAIYIAWSFISGDWHITWIIFPIGGLVCAFVSIVCKKEKHF
ncbi:MAG: helix-turn-helix domain-containing protein [Longicatena sp.]